MWEFISFSDYSNFKLTERVPAKEGWTGKQDTVAPECDGQAQDRFLSHHSFVPTGIIRQRLQNRATIKTPPALAWSQLLNVTHLNGLTMQRSLSTEQAPKIHIVATMAASSMKADTLHQKVPKINLSEETVKTCNRLGCVRAS